MDRTYQQNPEILRLTARSAAARSALGKEVVQLKQRLDVAGRLRESLRRQPTTWFLGSTLVGFSFAALFPRFRRKVYTTPPARDKSTMMRVLGMAWSAGQPLIKLWITNQLQSWLAQRAVQFSPQTSPRNQPR